MATAPNRLLPTEVRGPRARRIHSGALAAGTRTCGVMGIGLLALLVGGCGQPLVGTQGTVDPEDDAGTGLQCRRSEDVCDGRCAYLPGDPGNCGECGNRCADGLSCIGGECLRVCTGGYACEEGCLDLRSDPDNCGECGVACADGQGCRDFLCVLECTAPQAACGEVCRNVFTDASNCGTCGNTCEAGTQECRGGACETL